MLAKLFCLWYAINNRLSVWGMVFTEVEKGGGRTMFFSELEPETRIRLRITIEETLFEFETRVLKKHKKSMLILPIRKDGRILNVQGENVSVDIMLSREEDKPMIWQNTGMECVKHKGQICYAVPCELEGKE